MNADEVSELKHLTKNPFLYVLSPVMYVVALRFDLHSKSCAAGSWFNPTEASVPRKWCSVLIAGMSSIIWREKNVLRGKEEPLKKHCCRAFWNFSQTQLVEVDFCPGNGDIGWSATSRGVLCTLQNIWFCSEKPGPRVMYEAVLSSAPWCLHWNTARCTK